MQSHAYTSIQNKENNTKNYNRMHTLLHYIVLHYSRLKIWWKYRLRQFLYVILWHSCEMSIYLTCTLCCHITPKHDRVTTVYTPWTTPSVTVARNLSVRVHFSLCTPMVPRSEAEILNISKLYRTCKLMDGLPLTDKRTSRQWSKDRDVSPNAAYHGGNCL